MHDEEPEGEDETNEHVQFAMFIIDGECPKCGKVSPIAKNVPRDPKMNVIVFSSVFLLQHALLLPNGQEEVMQGAV